MWDMSGWVAWALSAIIFVWLIYDFFKVNIKYSEAMLASMSNGVITLDKSGTLMRAAPVIRVDLPAELHELPRDIGDVADVAATDSPTQLNAYPAPHFLAGTPAGDGMLDLSDIVVGRASGRRSPTDITLFCSVGLAGTEVAVANALLRQRPPS